jgi:hypothetical protein
MNTSTSPTETSEKDPEFEAMRLVYAALQNLDSDAQHRVLSYVLGRLGLRQDQAVTDRRAEFSPKQLAEEVREKPSEAQTEPMDDADDLAGVSPVAQKWIRRNGLKVEQLSAVFSLGMDNIELVARSVPGKSTREKMHTVLLLAGASAYLASGAARITDEAAREALTHYNAYDRTNFSTYMRQWAPEISGAKESGYTLTARGLAAAADLIKQMTAEGSG